MNKKREEIKLTKLIFLFIYFFYLKFIIWSKSAFNKFDQIKKKLEEKEELVNKLQNEMNTLKQEQQQLKGVYSKFHLKQNNFKIEIENFFFLI